MDPETRLIHARLDEWAAERRRALVADQPIQLAQRPANVDLAVSRLDEADRAVVIRYYVEFRSGDALWKDLKDIDSRRRFDAVLKRARWRVDGFLRCMES